MLDVHMNAQRCMVVVLVFHLCMHFYYLFYVGDDGGVLEWREILRSISIDVAPPWKEGSAGCGMCVASRGRRVVRAWPR